MSLLAVAQAFFAVGQAMSSMASEARAASADFKGLAAQGEQGAGTSGKPMPGDGGEQTVGASQSSGVVGTNALGAALQITRGRL